MTPPPTIQVETTQPRVIGTIYGPDGQGLAQVVDRDPKPFGFQPDEPCA